MEPVRFPRPLQSLPAAPTSALDEFLAEARARGLSERTRGEYQRLIDRYLRQSSALGASDLHRFVFGLGPSGRPPAPATAALRRAALVSYCAFLCRRGWIRTNHALELPRPHRIASLPRGLSRDEIQSLLEAIPDSQSGRRDRAVVITALFTGLRRQELFALRLEDLLSGDSPMLRVRVKGGQERLRPLPPPALMAIRSALPAAPAEHDRSPSGRLFDVSAAGFAANLRRYAHQADVAGVTPHVLRHTAAKLRREAGSSLEDVSAFLGHSSIATTAIYLRRLEGWRDDQWADVDRLLAIPIRSDWPVVEARAGPPQEWPRERGNAHPAEWQGGPEHGATLPISDSSRAASPGSMSRTEAAMSPPWRDERIGLLKSAVQKAIRRGETDLAYAAATQLLALPGGRSALARRLPVIAAEDVGWWWIPAASAEEEGPITDAELLRVTTGLSSVPKQKEAYHLADTVWDGRLPVSSVSADAFRDALVAGDHRMALAIALAARERRQWRSGERLIRVLAEVLADVPDVSRLAAESAMRREAKGGSGTDELLAAAIIAAIDRPDGEPAKLPVGSPPTGQRLRLPWWVADGHTALGERVLRRVAMHRGLPYQTLSEAQFSFESVVLGPAEIPSRWRAQAIAMDAVAYGWGTHERGLDLWRALRPEVSSALERELSRLQL